MDNEVINFIILVEYMLSWSYLWGLSPDFTSTSQWAVHLSSLQGDGEVDGVVLQHGQVHVILKGSAGAEEVQLELKSGMKICYK